MCDCEPTRREVLVAAAALATVGITVGLAAGSSTTAHALGSTSSAAPGVGAAAASSPTSAPTSEPVSSDPSPRTAALEVAPGLSIHPRDDWGADLPPRGPLAPEAVKFLLVHHTASSNIAPDPRAVIRQTYAFQTGPTKRWPDVCYHFFVGPDGSVWEGRAGSLEGPVIADATGGNQGHAQLICLVGNFMTSAPTAAAQESLMRLMLFLADRYSIDTDPSATVTFTSRGSDRFRAGSTITTSTISGHRDTSATACPGDLAYSLLPAWRARVNATVLHRTQSGRYDTATRQSVHLR
jgi:hypothetical protein